MAKRTTENVSQNCLRTRKPLMTARDRRYSRSRFEGDVATRLAQLHLHRISGQLQLRTGCFRVDADHHTAVVLHHAGRGSVDQRGARIDAAVVARKVFDFSQVVDLSRGVDLSATD